MLFANIRYQDTEGGLFREAQVGADTLEELARTAADAILHPGIRVGGIEIYEDPPVRCATFGGVDIPPEIRARMDADRAAAEEEMRRGK